MCITTNNVYRGSTRANEKHGYFRKSYRLWHHMVLGWCILEEKLGLIIQGLCSSHGICVFVTMREVENDIFVMLMENAKVIKNYSGGTRGSKLSLKYKNMI